MNHKLTTKMQTLLKRGLENDGAVNGRHLNRPTCKGLEQRGLAVQVTADDYALTDAGTRVAAELRNQ